MAVMQEFGELFAQALVAFATVADHDRVLEQLFLDRRRKLCPKVQRCGAQQGSKTIIPSGHGDHPSGGRIHRRKAKTVLRAIGSLAELGPAGRAYTSMSKAPFMISLASMVGFWILMSSVSKSRPSFSDHFIGKEAPSCMLGPNEPSSFSQG